MEILQKKTTPLLFVLSLFYTRIPVVIRMFCTRKTLSLATILSILLYVVRQIGKRLPNLPEAEYAPASKDFFAHVFCDQYGAGFPDFRPDWRRYLWNYKTPRENLAQCVGAAKKRVPLDQLAVADVKEMMRRILRVRYVKELRSGFFFSENQMHMLARNLIKDARIQVDREIVAANLPLVTIDIQNKASCIEEQEVHLVAQRTFPCETLWQYLHALVRPAMRVVRCHSKTVSVKTNYKNVYDALL